MCDPEKGAFYSFARIIHRDMRRLTTGIRCEKCVVRRFRLCVKVIVYSCSAVSEVVRPIEIGTLIY